MDIAYIAIVLGVILVSMTLHEAMHGFMAYWLGDDTAKLEGRLTLNPLKHIDPFLTIILPVTLAIVGAPIFGGAKPVPFNPMRVKGAEWGAALVALSGPLTNFLLALVGYGIFILLNPGEGEVLRTILTTHVMVNLGFFVFNMIPIPPLDGSRVLYALAPEFVRRGMEAIERYGVLLVFAIILLANQAIGAFMQGAVRGILHGFSLLFGVA